jgi:ankyrin repeat protein
LHEELFAAIRKQDIDAVEKLLMKVNVTETDKYALMMHKSPPVSRARHCPPLITILAKAGADVNLPNEDGDNTLELCVEYGDDEAMDALLAAGAKHPSLHTAYYAGDVPAIEALIKGGADPNQGSRDGPPLFNYPRVVNSSAIDALVKGGADLNLDTGTVGGFCCTPVITAAIYGWPDVIEALVKAGADVKQCSSVNGNSPALSRVLFAFRRNRLLGDACTFQTLATLGADLNQPNHEGCSPIWAAISAFGAKEEGSDTEALAIEALAKAGADLNAANKDGKSILDILITEHSFKVSNDFIAMLIAAGAKFHSDVNQPDEYEFTPIHYATLRGLTSAIEALIKAGADVNFGLSEGPPLGRAAWYRKAMNIDVETFAVTIGALIKAGADVNQADR